MAKRSSSRKSSQVDFGRLFEDNKSLIWGLPILLLLILVFFIIYTTNYPAQ